MHHRGQLDAGADPGELAIGLMAAYQGGYLRSQPARSSRPMAMALDLALGSIEVRRVRSDRAPGRADAVQARPAVTQLDLTVQSSGGHIWSVQATVGLLAGRRGLSSERWRRQRGITRCR